MEHFGVDSMLNLEDLPFFRTGIQTHYEGSIDKQGANADWDWWLYEENGEWVIFETEGPGCVYNLVQHRYPDSEEPEFRFYFDGEKSPRFVVRHSQFGEREPYIEPLASKYISPYDNGAGPIRVVRSFVPMAFQKSCRITSTVKLEGNDRKLGQGGWGHVIYQTFDTADGVETYSPEDPSPYLELSHLYRQVNTDPKPAEGRQSFVVSKVPLPAGSAVSVFENHAPGSVASIRMKLRDYAPGQLRNLWLRITFDGHEKPDILSPAGAFFGNELGHNTVQYLMLGMNTDGEFYQFFPMPYWESASIILENRGGQEIEVQNLEIGFKSMDVKAYPKGQCGYFRTGRYYERKHTEGADSVIGTLSGRGHLVAAVITGYAQAVGVPACEGDVRVQIDGISTPQIESDGSESYACYGWGFPSAPETNPISGYDATRPGGFDGAQHSPWCLTRCSLGDCYPFLTSLRFGIESGGNNDQYLEHSGLLFYYGVDEPGMRLTDEIDVGSALSAGAHDYRVKGSVRAAELTSCYEGDDDHIPLTDNTALFTEYSEFTVKIDPLNQGVRLRRRSDQTKGRQSARVFVDGKAVGERIWYFADRNPYKSWLEDEFEIPSAYTKGKSKLRIKMIPLEKGEDGEKAWNEYHYWIFSKL